MAANFGSLIETIVALFVDIGGNGVKSGGKSVLLAGAQKIGWARASDKSGGSRVGGHRLGGHSLGTGFGQKRDLSSSYNPKDHHKKMEQERYRRAALSGSGTMRPRITDDRPTHLFGRSQFEGPGTPLGRSASRYVRNTSGRGNSFTPRPRSFIRF